MLDGLEALIVLESAGTVSEAAVRLRLTQSAVSKRLQALEAQIGYKVVEADGRRLRLTPRALALISKAKPLISELQKLRLLDEVLEVRSLSIGIADSIASSWGAFLVQSALKNSKGIQAEMHVHRSTLIIEHLKLGRYEIGVVTGEPSSSNLVWIPLIKEEMVLVGKPNKTQARILTIEPASATWREIGSKALKHPQLTDREFTFVESFMAAVQMARAGLGQALVPVGLPRSLGIRSKDITRLKPMIHRQVQLVSRKSIFETQDIAKFIDALKSCASEFVS